MLPDYKIFTEREALQEMERNLELMDDLIDFRCCVRLVEMASTLDEKESEHLRQRIKELRTRLKTRNASIEIDNARERSREAVNAVISSVETCVRKFERIYLESADPQRSDPLLRAEAPKSREKELDAQALDRKERIQELNTPKSEGISSASKVLLGSALGVGVTMIMSVIEN